MWQWCPLLQHEETTGKQTLYMCSVYMCVFENRNTNCSFAHVCHCRTLLSVSGTVIMSWGRGNLQVSLTASNSSILYIVDCTQVHIIRVSALITSLFADDDNTCLIHVYADYEFYQNVGLEDAANVSIPDYCWLLMIIVYYMTSS